MNEKGMAFMFLEFSSGKTKEIADLNQVETDSLISATDLNQVKLLSCACKLTTGKERQVLCFIYNLQRVYLKNNTCRKIDLSYQIEIGRLQIKKDRNPTENWNLKLEKAV